LYNLCICMAVSILSCIWPQYVHPLRRPYWGASGGQHNANSHGIVIQFVVPAGMRRMRDHDVPEHARELSCLSDQCASCMICMLPYCVRQRTYRRINNWIAVLIFEQQYISEQLRSPYSFGLGREAFGVSGNRDDKDHRSACTYQVRVRVAERTKTTLGPSFPGVFG
jgi:hypothetical protein